MEIWWEVNSGRRVGIGKDGEIVCLEFITFLHRIESMVQLEKIHFDILLITSMYSLLSLKFMAHFSLLVVCVCVCF